MIELVGLNYWVAPRNLKGELFSCKVTQLTCGHFVLSSRLLASTLTRKSLKMHKGLYICFLFLNIIILLATLKCTVLFLVYGQWTCQKASSNLEQMDHGLVT
jgi:hypothetical protein